MPYDVKKADVFSCVIEDKPGGVAEKLLPLSAAGANLEFVLARRDAPGQGVLFVAPVKGAKQIKAAAALGLAKSATLQAVCIEGADKAGLGATMTKALAAAGINMRGLTAMAVKNRTRAYLAFDSADDAGKALKVLKKAL